MHVVKKVVVASALIALAQSASAIVIDSVSSDGAALAGAILGSGITISNVNYYGGSNQSGFFSNGQAVLGIDSGLIMTTGSAFEAPGPNNSGSMTGDIGVGVGAGAGDSDLEALILGDTFDAAVLTFDFVSDSDSLFFNYVFASEEYNEYVNSSFNDVFAFFVDGKNIAKAPDGQTVSINNVNCGNPYGGAGPNCEVFKNNEASEDGPVYNIQYDGFTNTLLASITGLGEGVHSMKIAIADVGDAVLDSAIFIQGGSFSSEEPEPTPVNAPGSLALLMLGLGGLVASRKRLKA